MNFTNLSKTVFLLCAWLATELTTVPVVSAQFRPSELNQGVVDGKCAISVWPALPGEEVPTDPLGFTAHFVPFSDLASDTEIVHPGGEWFVLPQGQYLWWIEGPGLISAPGVMVFKLGSPPNCHGQRALAPVMPAGKVALHPSIKVESGLSLRLLSAVNGMSRRVAGPLVPGQTVLMPAGDAIVALHDDIRDEYLGVTRPLKVEAGRVTAFNPVSPADATTDVYLLLEPPSPIGPEDDSGFEVRMTEAGGQPMKPDVLIKGRPHVYAFWYGVRGKRASVGIQSERLWMPVTELALRTKRVEYRHIGLLPLPSLRVSLSLPTELALVPRKLRIEELSPGGEVVRELEPQPDQTELAIERVPAQALRVMLAIGPWQFAEEVDLSVGADKEVVFSPRPIRIHGRVFKGEDPVAASVGFLAAPGAWVDAESDHEGRYEGTVFAQLRVARVVLPGMAPFLKGLPRFESDDVTVDFHLPDNTIRVAVRNKETKKPVPNAKVIFGSKGRDGESQSLSAATDADGFAALPPLRAGTLSVRVSAEGFTSTSAEREIADRQPPETIDIELAPLGELASVELFLPDGSPAVNSSLALTYSLDAPPNWTGVADARGLAQVPLDAGSRLCVRHPRSGFLLTPWPPSGPESTVQLRLPEAAPPLELVVTDPGGNPVPWAGIMLWHGGQRLGKFFQRWLLPMCGPVADDHGHFLVVGLPALPTGVLAWRPGAVDEAALLGGQLDQRRVTLNPPWSGVTRIEAIQ